MTTEPSFTIPPTHNERVHMLMALGALHAALVVALGEMPVETRQRILKAMETAAKNTDAVRMSGTAEVRGVELALMIIDHAAQSART
jgi:hypothetical protein